MNNWNIQTSCTSCSVRHSLSYWVLQICKEKRLSLRDAQPLQEQESPPPLRCRSPWRGGCGRCWRWRSARSSRTGWSTSSRSSPHTPPPATKKHQIKPSSQNPGMYLEKNPMKYEMSPSPALAQDRKNSTIILFFKDFLWSAGSDRKRFFIDILPSFPVKITDLMWWRSFVWSSMIEDPSSIRRWGVVRFPNRWSW